MSSPLGFAYNEDFDHFLSHYTPDDMTASGVARYVEKFRGTQIRRLFFCPAGQRTNFRSSTRESIWDGNDPALVTQASPGLIKWIINAKLLHDRGIDLYAHWIDAARAADISPWLSMRMNDVHFTEHLDHCIHNSFWKSHPEYWRVPGSVHAYADRSLDYGIEAVREFNLAFVAELLDRYDLDGLELDWMRFVYHFKPGHETRGGALLTGFMTKVRALADQAGKRRGRTIALSTRVPTRPEIARGLGLDAIEWARRGLVQQITISPFFGSTDFDIPLSQWIELLGPTRAQITLAPSLDMRLCAYQTAKPRWIDPDAVLGFASAMFDRGADLAYLFNYHYMHDHRDGRTSDEWSKRFVENLHLSPRELEKHARRHVVTFTDTAVPGVPVGAALPNELRFNRASSFRMDTGPQPLAHEIILVIALADRPGAADAVLETRANSSICATLPDAKLEARSLDEPAGLVDVTIPGAARLARFRVPPHWLERGHNLFEVFLRNDSPPQQIVWVELRVGSQAGLTQRR